MPHLNTFLLTILATASITVYAYPELNSRDGKLNELFDNSSQFGIGSRSTIVQKVLLHFINTGYLSRNLLSKSLSSRRPIIDFIETRTVKDSIRKLQMAFRLPVTGIIDNSIYKMFIPRCGNDELQKPSRSIYLKRYRRFRVIDTEHKFKRNTLTYSILNYPSRVLSKARVHKIIRRAFNEWARHSKLNFHELKKNPSADFRLRFASGRHGDVKFDGKWGVLAHAFMPPSGTLRGEIHFDDDESWTEKVPTGANLLSTACHEIGHSLGIHHSKKEKAIMYPVAIGYMDYFALHEDDIDAIQALYGKPAPGKTLPDDEDFYTLPSTIKTTTTPKLPLDYPDMCNTKIDAILTIQNELFLFYKQFYWRVFIHKTGNDDEFYTLVDTPRSFSTYWQILPKTVKRIDTAFYMDNGDFMFTAKDRFWTAHSQSRMVAGVPQDGLPLNRLGLPAWVKRVDAIFKWGYVEPWQVRQETDKMRSFLFSGKYFWEYKQPKERGAYGKVFTERFPFNISDTWQGVPNDISAAYTHTNYKTYFLKGYDMYRFGNRFMKVEKGYPKLNKVVSWFGCNSLQNK